jgi:plastocyanin
MKRTRPAVASLAMALVALAWLALPSFAQSKGVIVQDASFSPSYVEIDAGDSVTWTNVGENVHNIIGNSSNWPAGERLLVPGGSTTIDFPIPGSYSYTCEYHPDTMWGAVEVASGAGPTPTITSPGPSPSVSTSPSPSPSASASPTTSPTVEPVIPVVTTTPPTDPPPPFPTELPSFGEEQTGGAGPANPELASGSGTPPPDSAAKPPLTILGALAVILLFAGNPLIKPRPVAEPSDRRSA